jgi:hypothetical protein
MIGWWRWGSRELEGNTRWLWGGDRIGRLEIFSLVIYSKSGEWKQTGANARQSHGAKAGQVRPGCTMLAPAGTDEDSSQVARGCLHGFQATKLGHYDWMIDKTKDDGLLHGLLVCNHWAWRWDGFRLVPVGMCLVCSTERTLGLVWTLIQAWTIHHWHRNGDMGKLLLVSWLLV